MLSEHRADELKRMGKDELNVLLLEVGRQRDRLRAACEAAITELIEHEHQASTKRVLAQLRAALGEKSDA